MDDLEEFTLCRNEVLTSKLWIKELKSQYLDYLKSNAKDLPTDLKDFPTSIHDHIDYYSGIYAQNHNALVAYRAREIFAERANGAAFIPSASDLKKLEASVVEEERLLKQVQLRLSDKIKLANEKIGIQSHKYEEALNFAQVNEKLTADVAELEAELEGLTKAVEEKEQKERDIVEQQTRELQSAHNDLLRETTMRDEMIRESARLRDRQQRLKSDEKKRQTSAEDSQEQQRLVERWIKTLAPVVGAKVEGNTLVLTLGDGLGTMSNRRILAQFSELGKIESVLTDDGREMPLEMNHVALMKLLNG
ncbi:hypothetical protein COEREDRAFT_79550 [Coemansia reversa NRRL 1564]|uniref:Uncharacterized protein n=1 Tax=Coemansia reversa (strain ATCC 12441 / NRRL 1564) TaxID=763665 RepID=A0A2G5BJ66_COERN|nr:hypothetical protein COEREDRAFT_79550 [Coemansia reversa NRRL 1564]|eukprot:PIA19039.1 hypothetical protein COEREDRAFT_79550 [Coemansia reversa NRRL 1564]